MKLPVRILLVLMCTALVLAVPFAISAPNMLDEMKGQLMDSLDEEAEDEGEELDFGFLLIPSAKAEETEDVMLEEDASQEGEGLFQQEAIWELPLDFTVPPEPDETKYTENGYEDESIKVQMETLELNGVVWHLARVQIASATQLRTATAGKLTSNKTASVSAMAEKNNAVVAINGDNYVDKPAKTTFEYRMTQKIRSKTNKTKDILVIDEAGDFHLFVKSQGLKDYEGSIVNAMTFGPALVIDGELQTVDENYGYNPNGKEPRAALGQTGSLSYLLVIAEGRGESAGVTQQELAAFMYDQGCVQAFNLDGGNSAEMVFHGTTYKGMPTGSERSLSDIIYFATAVPEESRN